MTKDHPTTFCFRCDPLAWLAWRARVRATIPEAGTVRAPRKLRNWLCPSCREKRKSRPATTATTA